MLRFAGTVAAVNCNERSKVVPRMYSGDQVCGGVSQVDDLGIILTESKGFYPVWRG